ncbi:hypothetical protein [Paraburkholderia xenovorans]|jgi:hypothetical protein|uniref:Uncharacterized protein n=1 Tax=Paraburkholderia xenovorans (strain LB400) TaxID=266265 RepID=Q141Z0_PARXL|nr:hypothetical protein [Paraburkholderia xenovorans]ABE29849.1 hypothetical protein Bxe_A3130 [Paraburkholderia xenovorans LB400]
MNPKTATRSTLGSFGELPIEERLAGAGGREEIAAQLTREIDDLTHALSTSSAEVRKELVLLVECLRAARQVIERSANFATRARQT